MEMPVIDLAVLKTVLSPEAYAIAEKCCATRGGEKRLRATKPKDGVAAYVWRHVAFTVSPMPVHQCMPMTADFDIPDSAFAHRAETYQPRAETEADKKTLAGWDERTWNMMNRGAKKRAYLKNELDPIVDAIVATVPKNRWYGANRWGRALGMI